MLQTWRAATYTCAAQFVEKMHSWWGRSLHFDASVVWQPSSLEDNSVPGVKLNTS